MSLLGNIIWIIFGGGIILFILYLVGGLLLCLTIIGIPFGFQCVKLSMLALIPFGRKVVEVQRGTGCLSTVMNVLWIFIGGIWIAAAHLLFGVLCAITIIGIPLAKQHLKLASMALLPFGKVIE